MAKEENSNLPALPTRKITVFNTQEATAYIYETTVRTFGELKGQTPTTVKKASGSAPGTRPVSFDSKIVRIKETRNSLEIDSALLPEGNSTLYVYPAKSKSGSYKTDEVLEFKYNDARSLGSAINAKFPEANLNLNQESSRMKATINVWMRSNNKNSSDVRNASVPEKVRKSKATKASSPVKEVKPKKSIAPKSSPVEARAEKSSIMSSLAQKKLDKNTPHLTVLHLILAELRGIAAMIKAGLLTGAGLPTEHALDLAKTVEEITQKPSEVEEQPAAEQVNEESQEDLENKLNQEAAQRKQDEEREIRRAQEDEDRRKKEEEEKLAKAELKALKDEAFDDDLSQGTAGSRY